MAIGVYPGSFNPVTVAHLEIAAAAVEACGLDRVDLALSHEPLGKHGDGLAELAHRVEVLEALAAGRPWLGAVTTSARLLVDIADGYDVVVLGADKYAQLVDPAWYGGEPARDRALARLPTVAVAPRPPAPLPRPGDHGLDVVLLDVHPDHHAVSATAVRDGRHDWLPDEVRHVAAGTGAWPVLARPAGTTEESPGPTDQGAGGVPDPPTAPGPSGQR
jgi:hypothetical protein